MCAVCKVPDTCYSEDTQKVHFVSESSFIMTRGGGGDEDIET